jgi:hypothetical protein
LLLLDHPDELEELDELPEGVDGVGVLGLDELDQPDELEELDRLLLDEEREPPPLLLARAAPAGPKTRMNATAKARTDLDRMSTVSLIDLERQRRHDHARQAPYQSLPWFFIGGDKHVLLGAADISSIQHHLVIHHDWSLVSGGEYALCHLHRFDVLSVTPFTHESGSRGGVEILSPDQTPIAKPCVPVIGCAGINLLVDLEAIHIDQSPVLLLLELKHGLPVPGLHVGAADLEAEEFHSGNGFDHDFSGWKGEGEVKTFIAQCFPRLDGQDGSDTQCLGQLGKARIGL